MTGYDRAVLVEVLVYHYRDGFKGCGCGWAELGRSWPEHVATFYEESVKARLVVGGQPRETAYGAGSPSEDGSQ